MNKMKDSHKLILGIMVELKQRFGESIFIEEIYDKAKKRMSKKEFDKILDELKYEGLINRPRDEVISVRNVKPWTVKSKIKDWKKEYERHKACVKDFASALKFPVNSRINKEDLVIILNIIRKYKHIEVNRLQEKCDYTKAELNDITRRLKRIGEIYDPYLSYRLEGKFLEEI